MDEHIAFLFLGDRSRNVTIISVLVHRIIFKKRIDANFRQFFVHRVHLFEWRYSLDVILNLLKFGWLVFVVILFILFCDLLSLLQQLFFVWVLDKRSDKKISCWV